MQIDDSSSATLASARKPHTNFAQPARVTNHSAFIWIFEKLLLKILIVFISHKPVYLRREQRHLNKGHSKSVLQSNTPRNSFQY